MITILTLILLPPPPPPPLLLLLIIIIMIIIILKILIMIITIMIIILIILTIVAPRCPGALLPALPDSPRVWETSFDKKDMFFNYTYSFFSYKHICTLIVMIFLLIIIACFSLG